MPSYGETLNRNIALPISSAVVAKMTKVTFNSCNLTDLKVELPVAKTKVGQSLVRFKAEARLLAFSMMFDFVSRIFFASCLLSVFDTLLLLFTVCWGRIYP